MKSVRSIQPGSDSTKTRIWPNRYGRFALLLAGTLWFAFSLGWNAGIAIGQVDGGWKRIPLAIDANEGCAVGDIDGDGRLDVVAGRNWYAAPDFIPRPLRMIEDWNGYVHSNGDFLFDVNRDGRLDVIAGAFVRKEVYWYENPGPEGLSRGQSWAQHLLMETNVKENEAHLLVDLDDDGQPEWLVNSWNPKNPLMVWRMQETSDSSPGNVPFTMVPAKLAETGNSHGMGVGDLNQDGRLDVLTGSGWYEQPSENPWEQTWVHHPDWQIQASIPMLVSDLDQDGRVDILVGEGHDFGLHWWRQLEPDATGRLRFEDCLIDDQFSQPHTLALVDIDGDGTDELVTGKRYFAHNGNDPGGRDEPWLGYYSFDRASKTFHKTVVARGVGTGLQIACGRIDDNDSLDIAVAGKSGTFLLINPRR